MIHITWANAKKHICAHMHALAHTHTYSGPIHFPLPRVEVKLPSGPSQCDMLGMSGGAGKVCVWVGTTDIGKDANTDNVMTCRGRGRLGG